MDFFSKVEGMLNWRGEVGWKQIDANQKLDETINSISPL
jgi:hypothetical protein